MTNSTMVSEKRCGTCKEFKPLEAFSPNKSKHDGRQYICKMCRNKTRRRYTVDVTEKRCSNCGFIKPADQFTPTETEKGGLTPGCKQCNNYASQRQYKLGKKHYRKQDQEQKRLAGILLRHKLTQQDWENLLANQNGKCFCGKVFHNTFDTCIDHDHACCPGAKSCGKCVRGLLCRHCNLAIGYAHDSPAILIKLAIYLKVFEAQPIWLKRLKFIAERL